jgi:hypothetical protein
MDRASRDIVIRSIYNRKPAHWGVEAFFNQKRLLRRRKYPLSPRLMGNLGGLLTLLVAKSRSPSTILASRGH